jgi:hypothetical protein
LNHHQQLVQQQQQDHQVQLNQQQHQFQHQLNQHQQQLQNQMLQQQQVHIADINGSKKNELEILSLQIPSFQRNQARNCVLGFFEHR